jgi:hypothetical protein
MSQFYLKIFLVNTFLHFFPNTKILYFFFKAAKFSVFFPLKTPEQFFAFFEIKNFFTTENFSLFYFPPFHTFPTPKIPQNLTPKNLHKLPLHINFPTKHCPRWRISLVFKVCLLEFLMFILSALKRTGEHFAYGFLSPFSSLFVCFPSINQINFVAGLIGGPKLFVAKM